MLNEIKILNAVYDAVYDTFAYRLGPDDWEIAEAEFQDCLGKKLLKIQKPIQDLSNTIHLDDEWED